MKPTASLSRRQFLKASVVSTAGGLALPTLLPRSVFGKDSPGNKIHIAQIGCGRIAHQMDMPGVCKHPDIARIVAVCDLDSHRVEHAKNYVEGEYRKKKVDSIAPVKTFGDYRELLAAPDIDAVAISTSEHWHAELVVAAALAGKDIYVQKPLTMTLTEGRLVSDTVQAKNRIFQIGSQQRSSPQFRLACELVRNGRIGKLHTIQIGLPVDPSGGDPTPQPVPANLNYEMWLGPTPQAPYTEDRVHARDIKKLTDRPGWLRIESYCLGMITGWGSHHVDIAHWGMGTETTGPIAIEGKAEFPTHGLWNVHGPYHIEAKYANGVTMVIDNKFTNGVKFEGSDGWIFVSRGSEKVTASDPSSAFGKALEASDPAILNSKFTDKDIRLHVSENNDHHLDWLNAMKTRKPAVTTVEEAHRSTSMCILGWIAMKLGCKLTWDPAKETFVGNDQANSMLSRAERAPYGVHRLLKKA